VWIAVEESYKGDRRFWKQERTRPCRVDWLEKRPTALDWWWEGFFG